MAASLKQHGLILGDVVTQGLKQDELFKHVDANGAWAKPRVQPILHPLEVRPSSAGRVASYTHSVGVPQGRACSLYSVQRSNQLSC